MHAMLVNEFRKSHAVTCNAGYKCCDFDGRKHPQVRRSARRTAKQSFIRELRNGEHD